MSYSRLSLAAIFSDEADLSDPSVALNFEPYEATVEGWEVYKREVGTGSETYEMGQYSTVNALVIHNLDGTNKVTATFRTTANSGVNAVMDIGPGKFAVITDLAVANDLILIATGAACLVRIAVCGET